MEATIQKAPHSHTIVFVPTYLPKSWKVLPTQGSYGLPNPVRLNYTSDLG